MAQFDVYRVGTVLALDCQSDHLSGFATRLMVELRPIASGYPIKSRLNPVFDIDGQPLIMVTEFAAAVPKGRIGLPIASLSSERHRIIAALDMLITGV